VSEPATHEAPTSETSSHPLDDDARRVQRLHDVTHEIELLISGVVLFGLLQIPGRLDAWFDVLELRVDGSLWMVTFLAWYYVKLILYTLIFFFGLHLVSRAYWVGLVGLDSVFPNGIRWDRLGFGPQTLRVHRSRLRPLPTLARRADAVCSTLFSFAFWIVLVFLVSVVVGALSGLIAAVVRLWFLPETEPLAIWMTVLGIFVLFNVLPAALDKLFGKRLDPESRPARALRSLVRWSTRGVGGDLFLPIQLTLFSNISKRVIWPLYLGVFLMLVIVFLGGELSRSGTFIVSPSALLPDRPGVRSVDARYYADTRAPGPAGSTAPFIQSEIVEGPYVRLEVPLVARRHTERMVALCSEVDPVGGQGLIRSRTRNEPPDPEALDRVLSCLGGLWRVSLDGAPLEPEWDFRSIPGQGVTAVVTYLPTAGLEPGAHVLALEELPMSEIEGEEDERTRRHFIRFRR